MTYREVIELADQYVANSLSFVQKVDIIDQCQKELWARAFIKDVPATVTENNIDTAVALPLEHILAWAVARELARAERKYDIAAHFSAEVANNILPLHYYARREGLAANAPKQLLR